MKELKQRLDAIKTEITEEQRSLFSLSSIDNFISYYSCLNHYQSEVYNLLQSYLNVVEEHKDEIDKATSKEIGIKYVMKIGYYYSAFVGFKMKMKLDFAVFWGVMADLLLLLSGLLSKVFFIPIVTLFLLLYWTYIKLFFERKKKVFAVGY